MSAKFTPKIRNFVASSLIDSVSKQQIPEWQPLTPYIEGNQVFLANNKYIAKQSGTSGSTPPTHVSGSASDGGVDWLWIEYQNTNQMFKRNIFITIGRKEEWTDELTPDTAQVTDLSDFDVIRNTMSLRRVSGGDMRLAIKRYDWVSGSIFSQYDDMKDPLAIDGPDSYENPFYTLTDDGHIYKCINNNNGGESTSKPIDIGVNMFTLADGYVWKYMGSIDNDSVFFLTKDFVPVRTKIFNDGTPQWSVQNTAKSQHISTFRVLASKGTFPGSMVTTLVGGSPTVPAQAYSIKTGSDTIRQILVEPANIGEGYDLTSKVYAIVQRSGSTGTGGAVETITVTDGSITNITVGTAGSGYTTATAVVYDPTNTPSSPADIEIVISGGGSIQEFNVVDGGAGYSDDVMIFVIPGDAGAIGEAVFAPKEGHGSNIVTELNANTVIINVRLSEATAYLPIGEDNAFRQVALITDVVEKDTLEPAYNLFYLGPAHSSYGSLALNSIDPNIGYVLYINNLRRVIRDEGQEEDIRIAITF